jgi:hypothetical protein
MAATTAVRRLRGGQYRPRTGGAGYVVELGGMSVMGASRGTGMEPLRGDI